MKKYLINAVLLTVCSISFISLPSFASKTIKSCADKEAITVDYARCLDGVADSTDRELQTWINNQVFILEELAMDTGRKSALNMFKRSQSHFIRYREDNCRWQYLALSPSVKATSAYKKCYVRATLDRIKELSLLNK